MILSSAIAILFRLVVVASFETTAHDFNVDPIGNIYLVHPNYIERSTMEGEVLFRTSDMNIGEIETFDLSNPLRPFVFYKDQGKVLVYDNTLSQQGNTIDLFSLGYNSIECMAGSRGDGFWLWDAANAELVRLNAHFSRLNATGNLGVLLGEQLTPNQIVEQGDRVYLMDPDKGIFIFDLFGKYMTQLNINWEGRMAMVRGNFTFIYNQQLHTITSDLLNEFIVDLPNNLGGAVSIGANHVYFLFAGKILTCDWLED